MQTKIIQIKELIYYIAAEFHAIHTYQCSVSDVSSPGLSIRDRKYRNLILSFLILS